MRLQKYLAMSGVASRRKSEEYILNGLVKVNGKVMDTLGVKVNPKDVVTFQDRKVIPIKKYSYILLHKPMGVVSTAKDEKGRKTVVDLIELSERLYPVGRLDIDSTGLVLMTNDGEITQKIIHPKEEIIKTYIVTVEGTPHKKALEQLRNGVYIYGKKTAPAKVRMLKNYTKDAILEIKIHEGRNHQVKKMCMEVGHPVKKLKRIGIGQLELGGLLPGQWRYCNEEEVNYLRKLL